MSGEWGVGSELGTRASCVVRAEVPLALLALRGCAGSLPAVARHSADHSWAGTPPQAAPGCKLVWVAV